jgi:hypothetical protein
MNLLQNSIIRVFLIKNYNIIPYLKIVITCKKFQEEINIDEITDISLIKF